MTKQSEQLFEFGTIRNILDCSLDQTKEWTKSGGRWCHIQLAVQADGPGSRKKVDRRNLGLLFIQKALRDCQVIGPLARAVIPIIESSSGSGPRNFLDGSPEPDERTQCYLEIWPDTDKPNNQEFFGWIRVVDPLIPLWIIEKGKRRNNPDYPIEILKAFRIRDGNPEEFVPFRTASKTLHPSETATFFHHVNNRLGVVTLNLSNIRNKLNTRIKENLG